MAYFTEYDVGEIIVPTLLMEISTPFLAFTKFELLGAVPMSLNLVLFVISFFIFRVLICPYLMWEIFITVVQERNNPASEDCLPWHFAYIVFVFSMFFNCLNAYWACEIMLRIKRKIFDGEKLTENNDVKPKRVD